MTILMLPPELVEPPTWSIRPEHPIDLDQIHEVHREAFHGRAEAELVDAIRSGPDFLPELSLVAVTGDGSVLGHILLSRVTFEATAGDVGRQDVLALAPLAVLPPYQGSGIGTALMCEALSIADQRDEAFLVVLGSPAFYGRFGFVPADELEIVGPYEAAGDAFQIRPRPGGPPLVAGSVVYPPKFESV